jgi:hypothetical protein
MNIGDASNISTTGIAADGRDSHTDRCPKKEDILPMKKPLQRLSQRGV